MTHSKSAAGSSDWVMLRTQDGYDVVILLDDITMVWAGTVPGTILIELLSREEPLVVNYSSVKRFATGFLNHFDERKKGDRGKKQPLSLRVVSEKVPG